MNFERTSSFLLSLVKGLSAQDSATSAMAVPISDRSWDRLEPPLSRWCREVLKTLEFNFMTPVQSATIPYFLKNKDVAVEAVTGSGKTLAFVLPTIEILTRRSQVWSSRETGAIVLTPTRELAVQTAGVFEKFLDLTSLNFILLIGGRDIQKDIEKINSKGANVVVATPGRLIDLLGRHDCSLAASLHSLEVLVLDEADRLLELGFKESITTTLSYCPKQRRTGLFSATLNQDVKALMRAGMRNPVTITVKDKRTASDNAPTPKSLSNYYLVCEPEEKMSKLLRILCEFCDKKVIVFFATCASVGYFSTISKRVAPELKVIAIHGRMHKTRQQHFANFSELSCSVLMCTDVMARGVDFPSVDWVIQFDPPSSTKAFVHRCGRTARMGKEGQALVMLLPTEASYVEFLSVNQHICLQPYIGVSEIDDGVELVAKVRALAAKEREIYEQGKKAFVSFIHFYYKHECKLIFQPKELDLVGLAKGYALPHLPKMPELRGLDTSSFERHPFLPSEIRYKDKAREKQRLMKMKRDEESTIKYKDRAREKFKIKQAENASFKKSGFKVLCIQKKTKRRAVHSKRKLMTDSDLEELAVEARLLKKFKAGKISKKELDEKLDDIYD